MSQAQLTAETEPVFRATGTLKGIANILEVRYKRPNADVKTMTIDGVGRLALAFKYSDRRHVAVVFNDEADQPGVTCWFYQPTVADRFWKCATDTEDPAVVDHLDAAMFMNQLSLAQLDGGTHSAHLKLRFKVVEGTTPLDVYRATARTILEAAGIVHCFAN